MMTTKRAAGRRPTRVIVLDLDDTLYLERDFVRSGFAAVDAWIRRQHGIEGFAAAAVLEFAQGSRGDIFDRALTMLEACVSPDVIRAMVGVYRHHDPDIDLAVDARRLFERRGDVEFALLTDGFAATQRNKIRRLGLGTWIERMICTDELGRPYWKPHPRGFELIQHWFELPGSAFTYVGDNPHKDFIAPRALGWHTIRLHRAEGLHAAALPRDHLAEAHRSITTLDALDIDDVVTC